LRRARAWITSYATVDSWTHGLAVVYRQSAAPSQMLGVSATW
jgi:hypothetical protein